MAPVDRARCEVSETGPIIVKDLVVGNIRGFSYVGSMMMTTLENDALTLFPVSTLAMVEEVVWLPVIALVFEHSLCGYNNWGPLERGRERIEATAIEPSDAHAWYGRSCVVWLLDCSI